MRTPKVHPYNSINFTKDAKFWCEMINLYKKIYPSHTFKQIAKHFQLSETNARRYYYGIHHRNYNGDNYTQFRQGACVTI